MTKPFCLVLFVLAAASFSFTTASAASPSAADPSQPVKAVAVSVQQMTRAASPAAREGAIRQVLHDDFDLAFMARQGLGAHWEAATVEQRARFVAAIETTEARAYSERLGLLSGATLAIDKVAAKGAGVWTIDSSVDALGDLPALRLSWEVRDSGQGPRIVDVKVAGVSLFLTRRSEFEAVIRKNGGAVEPLVAELEARAAQ
jgi:phospholipid transport system substrate-binding protein